MYTSTDEGIEQVFFQKKDLTMPQLISKYFFMDIFLHLDLKFQNLRIPETFFFENSKFNEPKPLIANPNDNDYPS